MKRLFRIVSRKIYLVFIVVACFMQPSLVFAQIIDRGTKIAGCDINAPCFLQRTDNVVNMLKTIYCCSMNFVVKNLLYSADPQVVNVIVANDKLLASNKEADEATNNSLLNFISYYFSDKKTRDMTTFITASLKAEDDSGKASAFDIVAPIFFKKSYALLSKKGQEKKAAAPFFNYLFAFINEQSNKKTELGINNNMFSINNLLEPTQFTEDQKFYAQAFIQYIENISPPPEIIKVSKNFNIPYSPDSKKTSMNLQVKKKDATKIQNYLKLQPVYRNYKLGYRSQIAARTALIGNLLRSYQRRVPIVTRDEKGRVKQEESAEQAAFNGANWRLQNPMAPNSFYQEMQIVPPATVARETLILLAEIHRDMYEIQKQNERLIALQSISGLQTMTFSRLFGVQDKKKIGQLIYCKYCDMHSGGKEAYKKYDNNKSKNICGAAVDKCKDIDLTKPIEVSGTPDISKLLRG